ncbi:HAMP domain-containing histidine kinase [Candidatus Campbellbacteria bacterium]|nr:MAG: HAMP domain-containing histidine kinase [Candidatus Campbellbacteria bacterium]
MTTTKTTDGIQGRLFLKKKSICTCELPEHATDIFTDISHALQTPLSCLAAELQILERKTPTPHRDHLQRCEKIIHNMSALIHNALYISRLEQTELEHYMKDISLSELMYELIECTETLISERRIFLHTDIENTVTIHGVKEKVEELIMAVLSNSIKYSKPRGKRTLSITLHGNKTHAIIHVKDNGIGIAPEDLPHIFNRFYRTPHASAQTERGTGLGLAIAQKIAEKHKATITIESTLGIGTHVQILFPVKMKSA